jgi:lipoprotein-releasing system ATP-binding protein
MSPVVLAEAVEKTYFGKVDTPVLKGIELQVYEGEFVAVMGQSGSGKSTLLNLLGLLDRTTGGRLTIAGHDVAALEDDELASLRSSVLGFVFQFHNLLDEFSCEENALLPVLIQKGHIPTEDRERVVGLLRRVGLGEVLAKHPDEMSGGQNQRTAIVRALANQPRVVLADEPTGNLDATNGAEVFRLFRELGRETGVAVVMVTHDDRLAAQADRILTIEEGRIRPEPLAVGPAQTTSRDPLATAR